MSIRAFTCGALLALAACAGRTDVASSPDPSGTGSGTSPAVTTAGSQAASTLTLDDLETRMEKIGPAAVSLRQQLTGGQLRDAAKEAEQLALWFGDVERFWTQQKKSDAVTWAQQARRSASAAAGAAAGGDGAAAASAEAEMSSTCERCHQAYREADGRGGFQIKAGVLP